MKRKEHPSLEALMGARPFGRIHKPRYSSRETCTGPVAVEAGGAWRCEACGAAPKRPTATTEHRRMVEAPFWAFSYSIEGKRFSVSTKSRDHRDAVRLKHEILKQVLGGRLPWLNRDEPTLTSVCAMVRTHYENEGNRSGRRLELSIRTLCGFPAFAAGEIKARKITEARVEEYKAWRKSGGAASGTVNRELAVLRQGLRMAVGRTDEHGHPVLERMPTIRFLREAAPKQGFFEDEEFERVHRELLAGDERSSPQDVADLALFYFLTGWRNAEPRALRWANVNWFAKTITLPCEASKSREPRTFPFGPFPRLDELMRRRREITDRLETFSKRVVPWIFHRQGKPIRTFRRGWVSACARAGVPEKTPHDFRRTACRALVLSGVDPMTAGKLVGWESIAMVRRYKIDTLRDAEDAVRKLAEYQAEKARAREAALQMALGFSKGG